MDFSLVASVFDTLRLSPPSKLILLEACDFTSQHFPPTPPDVDTLIVGLTSRELALRIKAVLLAVYPPSYQLFVVTGGNKKEVGLADLTISEFSVDTCVYLPSLGEGTSFESFAELVAHLRAPDGCPWDKEQTHQTLRTHLLEETYETLSAMDANDVKSMQEEFGDLLLQIILNAQIASEQAEFSIREVIKDVYDKIVRRHPHVFGDVEVAGVKGVLQNWEKLKEEEREQNKAQRGLLGSVPAVLPALTQAQEYQDRAARVGFDWPEIEGVLDKIHEEIAEVRDAQDLAEVTAELGDLFFALVNLARWRKVDAESALRKTNVKFKRRFGYVETSARNGGRNLSDLSLPEMDVFWDEAKERDL